MASSNARTLPELLDAVAARDELPAVLSLRADGGVEALSCGALVRHAHAAAVRLLQAGLGHNEPVVLLGPNCPEWIVGYFSILCAGGIPVPLDCQAGGRDLAGIVAGCGARRAFTTHGHAELLRLNRAPPLAVTFLEDLRGDPFEPELTPAASPLLPRPVPDDIAVMPYTSGTTGTPKAVPLTHRNLLSNLNALVAARLIGTGDRVLLPLPLHHAYPFTCGLLGCLATGATLVLPAGVTGPSLVAAICGAGATVLLGVPRLYTALLAGIEAQAGSGLAGQRLFRSALRLSATLGRRTGLRPGRWLFRRLHREMGETLRILVSGGARLEPDVAWRLEGLGWEVFSGYGLTETSPILTFNIRGRVRHDTVGRPLPGVQLHIDAPATGATGATGEILARGPNVFAGYRGDPEATQRAFTPDGWFRTGDLGQIDADGYLHVAGRVKDMIALPDAKKFLPETVEEAYAASPLIREVAVLVHEGRLVALVVPDEAGVRERGAARAASLLREQIEAMSLALPTYERIAGYRLSHAPLPRTTMGKLQRFRLPALYADAEAATPAVATGPLSAADQALLASPVGRQLWPWLQQRFAGKPLTLDASPQLDLQVDSLEWVALTLEIRDRLGVELGQDAVGRVLTIRDLMHEVQAAGSSAGESPAGPSTLPATALAEPGPVFRMLGLAFYALDRLIMRAAFRLRVVGVQHLPQQGPVLLAPNHASYLDPMAVAAALPWRLLPATRWAGWTAFMFRTWHWRLLSRATGVFPVDPDKQPAAAIRSGEAALAGGHALVWFPEGRRTLSGEIGPFLPGVGVLLLNSGSRVIPVRITGTFEALPWHRRWPQWHPVTVAFGRPLDCEALEALGEGETPAERIATGLCRAVARLGP